MKKNIKYKSVRNNPRFNRLKRRKPQGLDIWIKLLPIAIILAILFLLFSN